jgi:hypothetical protein
MSAAMTPNRVSDVFNKKKLCCLDKGRLEKNEVTRTEKEKINTLQTQQPASEKK